ncbi:hypothetical protein J4433_03490 [Candidatus Pacearchaeota archaeon]|nr:hypothetical protein [Candidatus Pacearchaeota archaeon]
MAKLFDDKKREIFRYLDNCVKAQRWDNLDNETIHEKFDKRLGKKEVEGILEKLEEDKSVKTTEMSYTIYYPKDNEKEVLKNLSKKSKANLGSIYFIISIIWLYLIYKFPKIIRIVRGTEQSTSSDLFVSGFLISIIIIFITSNVVYGIFLWLRKRIPFFKKQKIVVSIFVSILLIILVAIFTQIKFPNYQLIATAIMTVITIVVSYLINVKN